MERSIKYVLKRGYNQFRGEYRKIACAKDLLEYFGAEEVSIVLLDAETAEISLETLVKYANEVVTELKKEDEAREQRLKGVIGA